MDWCEIPIFCTKFDGKKDFSDTNDEMVERWEIYISITTCEKIEFSKIVFICGITPWKAKKHVMPHTSELISAHFLLI